jgi:hypothetical protein
MFCVCALAHTGNSCTHMRSILGVCGTALFSFTRVQYVLVSCVCVCGALHV